MMLSRGSASDIINELSFDDTACALTERPSYADMRMLNKPTVIDEGFKETMWHVTEVLTDLVQETLCND